MSCSSSTRLLGNRDWRSLVEGTDYVKWFVKNDGIYGEYEPSPGPWGLLDVSDMWFNSKGELLVSDQGTPQTLKKFDLDKYVTTKTVNGTLTGNFGSTIVIWYNQLAGGLICGYSIGGVPYLAKFDDDLNLVWEVSIVGEIFKGVGDSGQYIVTYLGNYQFKIRRTSNGTVVTNLIDYAGTPLQARSDPIHYAYTNNQTYVVVKSGSHGIYDGAAGKYVVSWFLPFSWVSHHDMSEIGVTCFAASNVPSFTSIFNNVNLDIETWFPLPSNHLAFDPVTRGNLVLGTWKKGFWVADRRTYKPRLLPWRYCYDGSIGAANHLLLRRVINPLILGYKGLKLRIRGNGSFEVRVNHPIRPYSGVGVYAGEYLGGAVGSIAGWDTIYRDSMDTVYHTVLLDLSYLDIPVFEIDMWNYGVATREFQLELEAEV